MALLVKYKTWADEAVLAAAKQAGGGLAEK